MTVRIHRRLDSDTLYLPELRPLIGKNVEIIVLEEPATPAMRGIADWDAALSAVQELDDYDFGAFRKQRECDLKHSQDHLP